ncbi:SDR family oxidoreductase [Aquibacillus halophilus]|uniref:SDR family oxidoreductase n=1 Tax=Aquibacillus halophilus TaxID=930132 RepID=A0A6A8DV77_9BACI|nr:SDR family NAD(P)-dependent oxidoreductase [Aquibacillus halophilus]MRH45112.1 SDR family oxidoreductase [Aquibacillus halophilus]
MTDFSSVKDRIVIVTGAADGLGKAIAKCYSGNGMKVIVSDVNVEKGTETVLEIKEQGGQVEFFSADVSNEKQVKELISFAIKKYGRLDGIVNNAGISADNRPLHEYSLDEYERLMSINLKGVFLGMKYGIEAILKSKSSSGFVINIASMAGIEGNSAMGTYVGSKHGVVGFTKTAALDYAKYNITVNAICPGTFRTSIWGDASEEIIQQYANIFSPNGRLGDPNEVGYLTLFLASDLARYINGAVIPIDAGSGVGKVTPVKWEHPEILD